jgi:hypothetical protein
LLTGRLTIINMAEGMDYVPLLWSSEFFRALKITILISFWDSFWTRFFGIFTEYNLGYVRKNVNSNFFLN